MAQNIYDNPDFFKGYMELRESRAGLNETLEHPAMKQRLPSVKGKYILDLGCGTGDLCKFLADRGATKVTGVEISDNMISIAHKQCASNIELVHSSIEGFDSQPEVYDLIISSLAFHYIQDLRSLFQKLAEWLKPGGILLFSMEHPIATSSQGIRSGWVVDDEGRRVAWQVDAYSEEGERGSKWFVDGVVKYHRKMSSILNYIILAGLMIDNVDEPHSPKEFEKREPRLLEERKRPPFLVVKASKPRIV